MQKHDENENSASVFLPKAEYHELLANVEIPFSEEEIEIMRKSGGGCSLADIWKRLSQL
jgi:hypothetical protein